MGGVISTLTEKFQEHLERQRNRPFLEGVMAACALVATAKLVLVPEPAPALAAQLRGGR